MPNRRARIASSSGVVRSTLAFPFLLGAREGAEDAGVGCEEGDGVIYGEVMPTAGVSALSSSICARAMVASMRAWVFQNIAISTARNVPH